VVKEIIKCDTYEKRLVTGLILGLFVLGVLYAYFVLETTFNVVQRRSIERASSGLSSEVARLELEYIALKNNITREYAYELGYRELSVISYITRDPLALGTGTLEEE